MVYRSQLGHIRSMGSMGRIGAANPYDADPAAEATSFDLDISKYISDAPYMETSRKQNNWAPDYHLYILDPTNKARATMRAGAEIQMNGGATGIKFVHNALATPRGAPSGTYRSPEILVAAGQSKLIRSDDWLDIVLTTVIVPNSADATAAKTDADAIAAKTLGAGDITKFITSGRSGYEYLADPTKPLDEINISINRSVTFSGGPTGIDIQVLNPFGNAGTIYNIPPNGTKTITGSTGTGSGATGTGVAKVRLLRIKEALGADGIDHENIKSHIKSGSYTQVVPKGVRTTSSVVFKPLDNIEIRKKTYWYQPPAVIDDATQAIPEENIQIAKGEEKTIQHTYISPIPSHNTFSLLLLTRVGDKDTGLTTYDKPVEPFNTRPNADNPQQGLEPSPQYQQAHPSGPSEPMVFMPREQPESNSSWFSQETKTSLIDVLTTAVVATVVIGIVAIGASVLPDVAESMVKTTELMRRHER